MKLDVAFGWDQPRMHHQIIGTSAMGEESPLAADHGGFGATGNDGGGHGGVGGEPHWVDISYTQSTPMQDYNANYTFGVDPMSHGLASEPMNNRMGPPPLPSTHASQVSQPQQHHQPPHSGHPQLHPLITNPTWPSMLTNPGALRNPGTYSAPPIAMPTPLAVQPLRGSKTPTASTATAPRKTLTDDMRREICLFHRDNSGMKQTEIGARFGVERSTISKVLRNKEKFLNPTERSESPVKRMARGKTGTADIEKALSNWIKKSGVPVSDQEIREKAIIFCQNTPGTSDSLLKQFQSTTWLEKFKQRHGIKAPKLLRRASETCISHSTVSPASPHTHANLNLLPSPLSAARSDDEKEGANSLMEFTAESGSYRAMPPNPNFLSGLLTDNSASSSFSNTGMSPATFHFSPDTPVGGFLSDPTRHGLAGHPGFPRQRSQTLPILDIEGMNQPQESEPMSSKYSQVSTAPSSALESPMHDMMAQPFAMDASVLSPKLRRSSSNNSLIGRSTGTPVPTVTPGGSGPGSPTQENARRAVDTLLSYIQNGAGDSTDYYAVLRLTEKLGLQMNNKQPTGMQMQQQQQQQQSGCLSGLPRIPEGEAELSHAPQPNLHPHMIKLEPTSMSV
ncbi:hypothetical protein M0657_002806 [Pyricularia oryzae]|nr:hypothetical protein M9X92_004326 [Pyricularia oryzae]KAI7928123.1 hypothetical protein M0657_002806 [Pyricularia oryzae]